MHLPLKRLFPIGSWKQVCQFRDGYDIVEHLEVCAGLHFPSKDLLATILSYPEVLWRLVPE